MSAEIATQWVDWGKKTGSTIGTITAMTGLAVALPASTPAIAAVGTTAAIVGAMGYVVSTFAPAACAAFLKVGTSIILDGQGTPESIYPEVNYIIGNTIAAGTSMWLVEYMGNTGGEVAGAITGMLNDQSGFSSSVGKFVADAIVLSSRPVSCTYAISPQSKPFISSGGTASISVTAAYGCTWTAECAVDWMGFISVKKVTGTGQ